MLTSYTGSAGGGILSRPEIFLRYRAAQTSMVASLPYPIKLPVKFIVLGEEPRLICLNISSKASVAARLFAPNISPDAFLINLKSFAVSSSKANIADLFYHHP